MLELALFMYQSLFSMFTSMIIPMFILSSALALLVFKLFIKAIK